MKVLQYQAVILASPLNLPRRWQPILVGASRARLWLLLQFLLGVTGDTYDPNFTPARS